MAIIRDIETIWDARGTAHPTFVDAKIRVISTSGDFPLVQIDTFGSSDRKFEGKLSQTIQLDEKAARQLVAVLTKAFRL